MAPCHPVFGTACFACLCGMVCLAAKRRIHGFQHARGAAVRAVCTSVPGADSGGKSGVPCKGEKEKNIIDFRNEKASWMGAFFIWKYLQIKTNVLSIISNKRSDE